MAGSRKKSFVERFGKVPAGVPVADVEVVLQFLYNAFDKRAAKQIHILHPYWDEAGGEGDPPEMTVEEVARWLEAAIA